ncbi:hypothetical protein JCM30471_17660 [Desulfuromonas carbonis]
MQIRPYRNILKVLLWLLTLVLISNCTRTEEEPVKKTSGAKEEQVVTPRARVFLNDALLLQQVETSNEVLAIWRQYSQQKPTLLLFSSNPMLMPVPEELQAEVSEFINVKSREEIADRSTLTRPDPLLLPVMTVDAALRNDWFGQLSWALPIREAGLQLSPKILGQLNLADAVSEAELNSIFIIDNHFSGILREKPFVAGAVENLPQIAGPVVIHFDQSYFQNIYKNEIATPIFPLVFDVCKALRDRKIPVLAATFTYGNLEGRISLDVRFVGEVLQKIVEQPELLDKPLPKSWELLSKTLYLRNFFKKEEVLKLALELQKEAPESAWAKFRLYRELAENKQGSAALKALNEAVAIDRVYALEYLALSDLAVAKNLPDEAIKMLKLASEALPNNFQIRLYLAKILAEYGESDMALHLVQELRKLPWSFVYYADMPEELRIFSEDLKSNGATDFADKKTDQLQLKKPD